jgi:histidyl-tRNA synthetase
MKMSIPPGVFDILPNDKHEPWRNSHLWNHVENIIRETARQFGYQEIRTPIFERTELFLRGVGETTDIVSKEMYTFLDKGNRSMTLRPEGTAPVIRAFIENQLQNQVSIHKLFYIGPMFRYERSQAGRYRQHHQFGAEAIGSREPEQDVELIDMLYTLYARLGLKNLTVSINSIGDKESRSSFRTALKEYLQQHLEKLSPESKNRFDTNPLRILDSKDPQDQEIIQGAPSILDFLTPECKEHFEVVKALLDCIKIPYTINNKLVRGLDYYNKTVFEIIAGELGAQNSIGGGGRYDGLVNTLGGPDLPAIGFGTGIERIIQTMIKQEVSIPKPNYPTLFLIPLGIEAKAACFSILHNLRINGIPAQMDFSGKKLNKVMQYANEINARFIAVIGDEEIKNQEVELKEMSTGLKTKAPLYNLSRILEVEQKSDHFMKIWNEMTQPFDRPGEKEFFLKRLGQNIHQTQKLSENIQNALEQIKELL